MPFLEPQWPMQRVSPKETLQEKRKDKDMFLKINVENPFHLSAQAVAPLEALAVLARRGALRGSVAPPRPPRRHRPLR